MSELCLLGWRMTPPGRGSSSMPAILDEVTRIKKRDRIKKRYNTSQTLRTFFFLFNFAFNWHVGSFTFLVKCTDRHRSILLLERIYKIFVLKWATGSNWDQVWETYLQGLWREKNAVEIRCAGPQQTGIVPVALRGRGAFTPLESSTSQFRSIYRD